MLFALIGLTHHSETVITDSGCRIVLIQTDEQTIKFLNTLLIFFELLPLYRKNLFALGLYTRKSMRFLSGTVIASEHGEQCFDLDRNNFRQSWLVGIIPNPYDRTSASCAFSRFLTTTTQLPWEYYHKRLILNPVFHKDYYNPQSMLLLFRLLEILDIPKQYVPF